jgi:hypothetical protein
MYYSHTAQCTLLENKNTVQTAFVQLYGALPFRTVIHNKK